jgi:hypothetical protein
MEASTAAPPAAGESTNGTHPEGIGEDEAKQRAAQLVGVEGSGQLTFAVGGKKPDTSKVQLVGRSIELPGAQLEKGGEYTIQCRVRVGSVHFDDKIDSQTEQVTGCTRKHKARIVGDVHVIPDAE